MPLATRIVSEIAAEMGLVPLAWLVLLRLRGRRIDVAWLWLALAFAVSWLADTAALVVDPDLVGNLYPITQAAIIGAVFLDRIEAAQFAAALVIVAIVAILWRGPLGADVLLRTVAWGGVVGLVADRWALGRLRTALLVSFGLGTLTWWGYAAWPGLNSWLFYQGVRALGIAWFCWAAVHPVPRLALIRRDQ